MDPKALYNRIRQGHRHNVRFGDFCKRVEAFGFTLAEIEGSHHQYRHPIHGFKLSIQPQKNGDAKPYQISELLATVRRYSLRIEE